MQKRFDFITLILVLNLVLIGLIAIYSATHIGSENYFNRQMIYALIGFAGMIALSMLPSKIFSRMAYPLYSLSIISLILVFFIGTAGMGAERWLVFGPVRIQPSEFAKIATALAVGRYLSDRVTQINKFKTLLIGTGVLLLPFILIARQPDLGTALVFLALIIPVLYWAGLDWFYLFVMISPLFTIIFAFEFWAFMILMILITLILFISQKKIAVIVGVFVLNIVVGIITPAIWDQLHPYQQKRILTFLNPEQDPRGAGYQIIQSQVAIGSGGFWGKGYLQGSQTHLRFLPAQHTDFIFSVIGEEFGFIGISFIILTFLMLIIRIIWLASVVKSFFNSLVLIGIGTIMFFHVVINIAMTIGFAPVTGLPLPFISYGGSFLLANLIMIGIVLNIARNKFET